MQTMDLDAGAESLSTVQPVGKLGDTEQIEKRHAGEKLQTNEDEDGDSSTFFAWSPSRLHSRSHDQWTYHDIAFLLQDSLVSYSTSSFDHSF